MASERQGRVDVLRQRIAKLESQAYLMGTGNPETISYDVMEAMRDDPFMKISLGFIKMNVVGSEFILESESTELKEFIDKYFVRRFLTEVLTNGLLALDFGFSVQEKILLEEDGLFVPASYVSLKPRSCTLKVSPETGVYESVRYLGAAGSATIPNFKTWLFSFQEEFGNLYGKTIFRGAYKPWYDENVMTLTLLRHLELNGTGVAVVYFPDESDENSAPKWRGDALNVVRELRYNKEVVLPARYDDRGNKLWDLEFKGGEVRGAGFTSSIAAANQKKMLGVLVPPQLLLRESNTGSYAEAEVKLDVAVMLIQGLAQSLVAGINRHIIKQLVELNFNTKDDVQLRLQPMSQARQDFIRTTVAELIKQGPGERVLEEANKYMLESMGVKGEELETDKDAPQAKVQEPAQVGV